MSRAVDELFVCWNCLGEYEQEIFIEEFIAWSSDGICLSAIRASLWANNGDHLPAERSLRAEQSSAWKKARDRGRSQVPTIFDPSGAPSA